MFQKKQIFKLNILKQLLSDENGCVSLVPCTKLLAIPPFFLNDMKGGILYLLNCMLKKYDRSLGGIVIGYQNVKVLMDENTGIIPMGTSETEINIGVEFYIFQPKVGSLLEGVVNKKSSNHIGCLVHQYFNATILKPEDVEFDEWICKDFNVDDNIVFRVKELDFTSLLPLIEGEIDDSELNKRNFRSGENSSINDDDRNWTKVSITNEFLNSVNTNEQLQCKIQRSKNKKSENEESKSSSESLNEIKEESFSPQTGIEKKKKKEKVLICTYGENNESEDKTSDKREVKAGCDLDTKTNDDDMKKKTYEKKKKKKIKNEKRLDSVDDINTADRFKMISETDFSKSNTSVEKCVTLENSGVFLTPHTLKRNDNEKKNNKLFKRVSECLSPVQEDQPDDNVLCSTQLEPGSESKMKIQFCSPIPCGSFFQQINERAEEKLNSTTLNKVDGKGKKKNEKKRERPNEDEVDDESLSVAKRTKTVAKVSSREEEGLECNTMTDFDNRGRMSNIMRDLNVSDNENFKEKKRIKRKMFKELKESQISGGTTEEKGEQSLSDSKKINSSNERNSISRKIEISKETFKIRKKAETVANGGDHTSEEDHGKPLRDHTIKTERGDSKNKKRKHAEKKAEVSPESSIDSLYNKLLKDAITSINIEENRSQKTSGGKVFDPTDSSLSSFKKRKKSKPKESTITLTSQQSNESFKNGSMYDVTYSPEKLNPDKSLFTDSEQSHNSPVKKWKVMNGLPTPHEVQSQSFRETAATSTEKECSNDFTKNAKKLKKNRKGSLYEKLLNEAKKWIDVNESASSQKND